MTVTGAVIKNIIRKLFAGKDYRSEVLALINAEFLQFAVDFFKRVACAKLDNESVTVDWYKKEFLNSDIYRPEEIAIHSGLNKKTITNTYNSARKEIVLDASYEHYDTLYSAINSLTEQDDLDIALTIKFRDVSVDLNINESLIVINTLAVKRSALRGGFWSTSGKQVEKPLMITLCALFQVPKKCFDQRNLPETERESDFYLFDVAGKDYPCEVKLMGKGNPESADAAFARNSKVIVANKLSDANKEQLNNSGILWVELQTENGYRRFEQVLKTLSIPYKSFTGNLDEALEKILSLILSDDIPDSVTPEVILKEILFNTNSNSDLLIEIE